MCLVLLWLGIAIWSNRIAMPNLSVEKMNNEPRHTSIWPRHNWLHLNSNFVAGLELRTTAVAFHRSWSRWLVEWGCRGIVDIVWGSECNGSSFAQPGHDWEVGHLDSLLVFGRSGSAFDSGGSNGHSFCILCHVHRLWYFVPFYDHHNEVHEIWWAKLKKMKNI